VFKDLYGSVSGTGNPAYVVTNLDFYKTPACDTRDNMKAAICSIPEHVKVIICYINDSLM
jgi:hypothetical protein